MLAFCSKQKGPQVPSCRSPIAGARCSRPKCLSYRDLSWAASRSLDSEGDAGGSLSETQVLVTIEDKTYLFFSQSWFLSSARSSTVARSTFPSSLCFKPCSVSTSKGPVRPVKSLRRVSASSTECLSRSYGCHDFLRCLLRMCVSEKVTPPSSMVMVRDEETWATWELPINKQPDLVPPPRLESQSERIILNNNII